VHVNKSASADAPEAFFTSRRLSGWSSLDEGLFRGAFHAAGSIL